MCRRFPGTATRSESSRVAIGCQPRLRRAQISLVPMSVPMPGSSFRREGDRRTGEVLRRLGQAFGASGQAIGHCQLNCLTKRTPFFEDLGWLSICFSKPGLYRPDEVGYLRFIAAWGAQRDKSIYKRVVGRNQDGVHNSRLSVRAGFACAAGGSQVGGVFTFEVLSARFAHLVRLRNELSFRQRPRFHGNFAARAGARTLLGAFRRRIAPAPATADQGCRCKHYSVEVYPFYTQEMPIHCRSIAAPCATGGSNGPHTNRLARDARRWTIDVTAGGSRVGP